MQEAKAVIEECRRERGFFASTERYREFWIRDIAFSEDALLRLGYAVPVRRQFEEAFKRQRGNGEIPAVISPRWRSVLTQQFQSWTSDSDILLLIGCCVYAEAMDDWHFLEENSAALERCLGSVEGRRNQSGFIVGMDWRDAVPNYLGRCLLSNQVLLVRMYRSLRREKDAEELKSKIRDVFFSPSLGFYADSVWWDHGELRNDLTFDSFGNSLAILEDVYADSSTKVATQFRRAWSPFGQRNISPPLGIERSRAITSLEGARAFLRNGAIFRNRRDHYQNSAIWPFVEKCVISALVKVGSIEEAERMFEAMLKRRGMSEWYDPRTGNPKGSEGQLMSAASILEAARIVVGGGSGT